MRDGRLERLSVVILAENNTVRRPRHRNWVNVYKTEPNGTSLSKKHRPTGVEPRVYDDDDDVER